MKIHQRRVLFYLAIIFCQALFSQVSPGPAARFSFNNGTGHDEVNNRNAKLVNTSFVEDRFGNDNSAAYIAGNNSSYINLGNYPQIKPKEGSISLWVKLEGELWSGTGYTVNPIILTKNSENDDFYEAYAIVYSPETKKVNGGCSKDGSVQTGVTSLKKFPLFRWHHVVLTYDYHFVSLYIDGNLERSLEKNYETKFNPMDSVLLGVTGNKKNKRCSEMSVDDIEFYDRVLAPAEVANLYRAPNPNKNRILLNWALVFAAFIALVASIFFFVRYHISKTLKKEKEKLELANTILETELRVNRALMNPHFIFNSLNALHNLILDKELDNATDYLVKFSKLIRKILDSNLSGIILLEQEVEILNKYLEIEALRFDKDIRYEINVHPLVVPSKINIPIMMIQPFVENAIWHGLINKPGEKHIVISFSMTGDRALLCMIEDNGLGRREKENAPTDKKSLATDFIMQRLQLLNKIYNLDCGLSIEDKPGGQGTLVRIVLPVLNL
jgi:hypothetical protein